MSNIIVHGLAMLGVVVLLLFLCKFVFLVILSVKRKGNPNNYWSIVRTQMFDKNYEGKFYLIPTIEIHTSRCKSDKVLEIEMYFLKWEFYTSYNLSCDC